MKPSFPKIFSIGTDYIKNIFDGPVEITEKVDGSQFGFGLVDGSPVFRSKGKQIFLESVDSMFRIAVDYSNRILHSKDLPKNVFFYCEYLQTPHHNTLAYDRVPKNHLALFGVVHDVDTFQPKYSELEYWSDLLEIETVPLIYHGKVEGIEVFKEFLDKESFLGGPKIEGVVVKNYANRFLLGGQPIPIMAGKFVSDRFKELHKSEWKSKSSKSQIEKFLDGFNTEARWEKAVQHLRDEGKLVNDPKDIGSLIKHVHDDVIEEEESYIKDSLFSLYKREIGRRAVRGLPEWYKDRLLGRVLGDVRGEVISEQEKVREEEKG